MLGFWSSSKDIGNILGFLVCTIVIVEMKIGYDIALVIVGLFSLFFTIAVYNLKIDP